MRNVNNALALHNWNINIASQAQIVARNQSGFQPIAIIFYVFTALVSLVGMLGLAHTLTNAVLERQREIGLWRSMGATSGRVGLIFWIEGLAFALLAWTIGLLPGLPLAEALLKLISQILFSVTFTVSPLALAETLGLVMLLASLASLGPALSASRLRINQALRYE
ncbi:MAG TPA: FtsX-like permease family protein [Ktedonobacteraceae bacterium]|nr:FtsX-like permease family protein [Ktedonobacteraceae bacterium]